MSPAPATVAPRAVRAGWTASLSRFFGVRPIAPGDGVLVPRQLRWLGALLFAVQLPQTLHLPLGISVLGLGLVALRLFLVQRAARRPGKRSLAVPSWALALFAIAVALAIRQAYGYFLGREPSIAFLFVLCGIKFLEARGRRDGTLIACLAAFMLITPFLDSQTMSAAALSLPGIVMLGGALDVLARGGGAAGPPAAASWRAPLRRAAVLMLQGLPIAALLFFMFPRLAAPLWGLPADRSARTGLSDTMTPGMFSELTLSDEVAFRVDFEGPPPPPAQRYWRGPVMSRYDGRVWSAASLPILASPLNEVGGKSVLYTVTLEPNNLPWLFALDLPSSVPRASADGSAAAVPIFLGLTRDQQLLARAPITQPVRYAVLSTLRDSFPATSQQEARANVRLPPGSPRTTALARELRERNPDDAAYIRAVLLHFHDEPFVYTLAAPLYERDPVDQFMFEGRRGFCEHYASAFTVMLRAAGIPARVVTGYQGGEMNPTGGYMIVRQSDAHAWTEALVNGRWQRYDPTAAVAPSRVERGFASSLPEGEPIPLFSRLDGGWLKDLGLVLDSVNHSWRNHVVDFNYQRQRALWRDMSLDVFAPWQIVVAVAAAAGLWGGGILLWLAVRRRRKERALVLWDDVCRRLARAGLPREAHEGPLAFAQRAAARWPQFAIAFAAIGEAYATLRYGALAADSRDRAALVATLEHAIDALPASSRLRGAALTG